MKPEFFDSLKLSGFVHRKGGIFSKKGPNSTYCWLSLDDQSNTVLCGMIFPKLVNAIYEIAQATSFPATRSFPLSWGPPAFTHRLSIDVSTAYKDPDKLTRLADLFLRDYVDLRFVLYRIRDGDLFSWNRVHVVAAGLLILNECADLEELLEMIDEKDDFSIEYLKAACLMCRRNLDI